MRRRSILAMLGTAPAAAVAGPSTRHVAGMGAIIPDWMPQPVDPAPASFVDDADETFSPVEYARGRYMADKWRHKHLKRASSPRWAAARVRAMRSWSAAYQAMREAEIEAEAMRLHEIESAYVRWQNEIIEQAAPEFIRRFL